MKSEFNWPDNPAVFHRLTHDPSVPVHDAEGQASHYLEQLRARFGGCRPVVIRHQHVEMRPKRPNKWGRETSVSRWFVLIEAYEHPPRPFKENVVQRFIREILGLPMRPYQRPPTVRLYYSFTDSQYELFEDFRNWEYQEWSPA